MRSSSSRCIVEQKLSMSALSTGALGGRWLAGRLNQTVFDRLVIVFTVVGAVYLLF